MRREEHGEAGDEARVFRAGAAASPKAKSR